MGALLLAVKPSILWAGTSKLNVVVDTNKQPAQFCAIGIGLSPVVQTHCAYTPLRYTLLFTLLEQPTALLSAGSLVLKYQCTCFQSCSGCLNHNQWVTVMINLVGKECAHAGGSGWNLVQVLQY